MNEPLEAQVAKKLIRAILADGELVFTGHSLREMAKDPHGPFGEIDVRNVLYGGVPRAGEWENGAWRYRFDTERFSVVIEFESETAAIVVTAWRNKR